MSSGIALDDAAIMSTALEGILYGVFLGCFWESSSVKQVLCRIFAASVYCHRVGVDLRTGPSSIQPGDDLNSYRPPGSEHRRKPIRRCSASEYHPPRSFKHMVVDIVRIDEGLVKYRDTFPGGPVAFFEDIAQNTFVIKNAIYTLQTLVGDGVVVGSDPYMNCIC